MMTFKHTARILEILSVGVLMLVFPAAESHAASCESLRALALPNTTITLAQPVEAGAFSSPDAGRPEAPPTADFRHLPPFCRVTATLRPSSDSDTKIEVWLPRDNWNGKFQGVGNGGLAGFITYTAGRGGIERGLAEASRSTRFQPQSIR